MSEGRQALTLAELSADLIAAPVRAPRAHHRERAQAQRRKRISPPAPDRTACGYCTRPALPDRYVCERHADRIAAIAAELKARSQRKRKGAAA